MFQFSINLEALQTSLLCTMAHLAKRHTIDMEITEALEKMQNVFFFPSLKRLMNSFKTVLQSTITVVRIPAQVSASNKKQAIQKSFH